MAEFYFDVVYEDESTHPKLPGMENIEVVDITEIDESIVLDGSNAETGVRVNLQGGVLECEIFLPTLPEERWIEIYPLDGRDEPIMVNYEIGPRSILEDKILKGVVRSVFEHVYGLKATRDVLQTGCDSVYDGPPKIANIYGLALNKTPLL